MDSEVKNLNDTHLSDIDDAARALREIGLCVLAGQVELARDHFAALAAPSAGAEAVPRGYLSQTGCWFDASEVDASSPHNRELIVAGKLRPIYTAPQPDARDAVAVDEAMVRDAKRWRAVRSNATQNDWQRMAARCTTGLALDRYADSIIDAALTAALTTTGDRQ